MRALAVGLLLAAVFAPAAAASPATGDFCAAVGPGVTAGTITDPALVEISGLAASRTVPEVLWANNDSGDGPRLYALSSAGELLGVYDVAGAEAIDWEDIAVGPGPDPALQYLYVGDIGQNGGSRDHVEVYRAPEPALIEASGSLPAERIDLTYPGGPEDAESMFVDPVTGGLVIVTKQVSGVSHVLLAEASELVDGANVAMQQIATITIPDTGAFDRSAPLALPSTMATAADISPDGSAILVRTYQQVLAYSRPAGGSLADAFASTPCSAPQVSEPQGEAIAFAADGSGYSTASEIQLSGATGATLTFFPIAAPLPPPTTAPTTIAETEPKPTQATATTEPATTTIAAAAASHADTTGPVRSTSDDGDGPALALGIGALVVAAVLVGLVLVVRRRRAT